MSSFLGLGKPAEAHEKVGAGAFDVRMRAGGRRLRSERIAGIAEEIERFAQAAAEV